jgi:hypothetical protein
MFGGPSRQKMDATTAKGQEGILRAVDEDSDTDSKEEFSRSDGEYVLSEHSDNDEVDAVSASELRDGNNDTLSSSDESDSLTNVTVYSAPSGHTWQENPPPFTRRLRSAAQYSDTQTWSHNIQ